MSADFILAQISDMHIMTEPRTGARGERYDHTAQMKRAFEQIAAFKPHAIIATGDLVNDARADEYAVLAEALRAAPAPLYVLPGNHDDRALIRDMLPDHAYLPRSGSLSYVIDDFPVCLVCLDQVEEGETYGVFTEAEAAWLDRTLAAKPQKTALVALHHPPFQTHDRLFDTIGLKEAERFERVVAKHAQVERIVCGHHHRGVYGRVAHAPALAAPSTAWAYSVAALPDQPLARITSETPGWALHLWSDGRGFASHFMGL